LYYSLLGRDVERDIIPMMSRYGLGLTVWSPLASGFLSGKYTRDTLKDPANRLAGFDFLPFDKERGFALVETMRTIAKPHGATVAQVALAWLLAKPRVSAVLLGATKSGQLTDNLGAAALQLTDSDIAALDAATPPEPVYPNWFIDNLVDTPVRDALKHR
jgi:aryl-alcohol dehydrogenase-like predicted oxidoreductase